MGEATSLHDIRRWRSRRELRSLNYERRSNNDLRILDSSINLNLFYYLDELVSKAPLCKGSWHGACEVTEGLLIGAHP